MLCRSSLPHPPTHMHTHTHAHTHTHGTAIAKVRITHTKHSTHTCVSRARLQTQTHKWWHVLAQSRARAQANTRNNWQAKGSQATFCCTLSAIRRSVEAASSWQWLANPRGHFEGQLGDKRAVALFKPGVVSKSRKTSRTPGVQDRAKTRTAYAAARHPHTICTTIFAQQALCLEHCFVPCLCYRLPGLGGAAKGQKQNEERQRTHERSHGCEHGSATARANEAARKWLCTRMCAHAQCAPLFPHASIIYI